MLLLFFVMIAIAIASRQQMDIREMIRRNGYTVETHFAKTPDAYNLVLHRIPKSRNGVSASKGAVLLQHGLTDASAGWALNPPYQSLAYILADNGYDVWMGNNRGNGYSMSNDKFSINTNQFWNFTWDEMATIDFPTLLGYVVNFTGAPKISYIGHSEGTIQAFAGLTENPQLANYLKVYIAMAPVAYVGNIQVGMLQALSALDADALLTMVGAREFFLPNIVHKLLGDVVCNNFPNLCGFGASFIYGQDTYLNNSKIALYELYEPFPTSAKNIIKWAQGVRTNTFQKFDYGSPTANIQAYGTPVPPKYDLQKFPTTLPTVLFTGGIDGLADVRDVQQLLAQLPIQPTVYGRADYGHLDFLVGDRAFNLTYPFVLQELAKNN